MKLSECKIGTLVEYDCIEYVKIGHIVGLQYNVDLKYIKEIDAKKRIDYVIPIVKWVDGTEYSIHHNNIRIFKD